MDRCIAKNCSNTPRSSPDKFFVLVPYSPFSEREKWFILAGADLQAWTQDRNLKGMNATAYCCQDHFKLSEDLIQNQRLGKSRILRASSLKPGVYPRVVIPETEEIFLVEKSKVSSLSLSLEDASDEVDPLAESKPAVDGDSFPPTLHIVEDDEALATPKLRIRKPEEILNNPVPPVPPTLRRALPAFVRASTKKSQAASSSDSSKIKHHHCIARNCLNTSRIRPESYFVPLPTDLLARKSWLDLLDIPSSALSESSSFSLALCKEHFEEMESAKAAEAREPATPELRDVATSSLPEVIPKKEQNDERDQNSEISKTAENFPEPDGMPNEPDCGHNTREYQCTRLKVKDFVAFYLEFHQLPSYEEKEKLLFSKIIRERVPSCEDVYKFFIANTVNGELLPVCRRTFWRALSLDSDVMMVKAKSYFDKKDEERFSAPPASPDSQENFEEEPSNPPPNDVLTAINKSPAIIKAEGRLSQSSTRPSSPVSGALSSTSLEDDRPASPCSNVDLRRLPSSFSADGSNRPSSTVSADENKPPSSTVSADENKPPSEVNRADETDRPQSGRLVEEKRPLLLSSNEENRSLSKTHGSNQVNSHVPKQTQLNKQSKTYSYYSYNMCHKCITLVSSSEEYAAHRRNPCVRSKIPVEELFPILCNVCKSYSAHSVKELKMHIQTCHKIVCKVCSTSFACSTAFDSHWNQCEKLKLSTKNRSPSPRIVSSETLIKTPIKPVRIELTKSPEIDKLALSLKDRSSSRKRELNRAEVSSDGDSDDDIPLIKKRKRPPIVSSESESVTDGDIVRVVGRGRKRPPAITSDTATSDDDVAKFKVSDKVKRKFRVKSSGEEEEEEEEEEEDDESGDRSECSSGKGSRKVASKVSKTTASESHESKRKSRPGRARKPPVFDFGPNSSDEDVDSPDGYDPCADASSAEDSYSPANESSDSSSGDEWGSKSKSLGGSQARKRRSTRGSGAREKLRSQKASTRVIASKETTDKRPVVEGMSNGEKRKETTGESAVKIDKTAGSTDSPSCSDASSKTTKSAVFPNDTKNSKTSHVSTLSLKECIFRGDRAGVASCPKCNKEFNSLILLKNHLRENRDCKLTEDEKDLALIIKCRVCRCNFTSQQGLSIHFKRSPCLNGIPPSPNKTPTPTASKDGPSTNVTSTHTCKYYVCQSCGSFFTSVWGLKSHYSYAGSQGCAQVGYNSPEPVSRNEAEKMKKEITSKNQAKSAKNGSSDSPATSTKSYICEKCNAPFVSCQSFQVHSRTCQR